MFSRSGKTLVNFLIFMHIDVHCYVPTPDHFNVYHFAWAMLKTQAVVYISDIHTMGNYAGTYSYTTYLIHHSSLIGSVFL